ncbi:hypothetical protein [Jiella sonneratiae]|uniref:DUF2125 domain-containing protein n=1 Tax=Jiella sonneratiae TaxID=2816856 RepID=A0ABS3J4X5_9HYPH|nr:hypothetical protein [Jiella sonneratiae]MBO0904180.1 hypothetical protein [Jiella sonneratiae]
MQLRTALAALLVLIPVAAPAQPAATAAGDATAGKAGTALGAAALTAALKDYLGPLPFENGLVSIEPDPAGYRIVFGGKNGLSTGLPQAGNIDFDLSPYAMIVSQQDDGNWKVTSDGAVAMSYDLVVNGQKTHTDYAINGVRMEGVYAPAIRGFLTGTGTIDEIVVTQTQPNGSVSARVGPQTFETKSLVRPNGNVDYTLTQKANGLTETLRMPLDPAKPDELLDMTITAGSYGVTSDATDFRSRQIADLLAFLLRRSADGSLRAAESDMKHMIGEAMPLWASISGDTSLDGLSVKTPFGKVEIGSFAVAVSGDGIVTDGTYRYHVAAGGMVVDFPQIPEWAKPLIPADAAFDVVGAKVDLETPARILVSRLDLSAEKPISDEVGQEIAATFEKHRPELRFENVKLAARDYELTVDGQMTFEGDKPQTRFDIVATGLDKTLKALQDAGAKDQQALQGFAFGSMAKGFGKQLPDGRTQWLIETAADGSVKINGVTIKGPDAAAEPPTGAAPGSTPGSTPGEGAGGAGGQPL